MANDPIVGVGNFPPARNRRYHRVLPRVSHHLDTPSRTEDPLNLFTLPYMELLEAIAETLFPPNQVKDVQGDMHILRASDARVDRYVMFRSAWDHDFHHTIQLALLDITNLCFKRHNNSFVHLTDQQKEGILRDIENGQVSDVEWPLPPPRTAEITFELIYYAVLGGLLGEPGYGGNAQQLGWYYVNFKKIGD